MSTHADYRQRAGKLEVSRLLWAVFPAGRRIPASADARSGAHVDVPVPPVVLVAVGVGRALAALALGGVARGAIPLARDALQTLDGLAFEPRHRGWTRRDRMDRIHHRRAPLGGRPRARSLDGVRAGAAA